MRLEHRPFRRPGTEPTSITAVPTRPILITGATGTLGRAFAGACRLRGLPFVITDRAALAITDPAQVARALDLYRPWAVINAAGFVRVDDAEEDAATCYRENADGAAVLARACAARNVHLTVFSSDLVFDGEADEPYVEDARPDPLNVYGASKAAAERCVMAAHPGALVVRTAAFFSPYDEHNFARPCRA